MTTKRIVWLRPDGGVSVTCPAEPMLENESETDYLNRIATKAKDAGHIPADWVQQPNMDVADAPNQDRSTWGIS